MAIQFDLGQEAAGLLSKSYTLKKQDIGKDAKLSKQGITMLPESYEIEGIGHLCILNMKVMFGMMKMATVVIAPQDKDLPLMNLDWVHAGGKETLYAELYDTQLAPVSEERLAAFQEIKEKDADLLDVESEPRWYDPILYPCSYRKNGKGIGERLALTARAYLTSYVTWLADAPTCDTDAKRAKNKAFAATLLEKGGPAVNQVTKLFGAETAARLVLSHMYGVE